MTFIKDKARDYCLDDGIPSIPSQNAILTFHEHCVFCDRDIPEGKLVIRYLPSKRILCIFCLMEIAEVK